MQMNFIHAFALDGFRGSRPDMLGLIASHWKCKVMELPHNYRCCPSIVEASRFLMRGETVHPPIMDCKNVQGDKHRLESDAHRKAQTSPSHMRFQLGVTQVADSWTHPRGFDSSRVQTATPSSFTWLTSSKLGFVTTVRSRNTESLCSAGCESNARRCLFEIKHT